MKRAVLVVWLLMILATEVSAWAQKRVHVRSYVKKDGTVVRAHTRSAPGSRSAASSSPRYYAPAPSRSPSYSAPANYPVQRVPAYQGPVQTVPRTERAADEPAPAPITPPTGHEIRVDPILEYQKKDAAKGFCEAQFALGIRYLTGNGVEKNEATGWDWINQASKNGSLRARDKIREHNSALQKARDAELYKDVPK